MMRIDIITIFPEMIEGFFNCSIMARAQKKGLAEIHLHNLRDWTLDKHKRVDDYPYGGCAGMVSQRAGGGSFGADGNEPSEIPFREGGEQSLVVDGTLRLRTEDRSRDRQMPF